MATRHHQSRMPARLEAALGYAMIALVVALMLWGAWSAARFWYHLVFGWPAPEAVSAQAHSAALARAAPSDAPQEPISRSDAKVAGAAATAMKQFFPKAVDHSASASYQREWFMVKGIVRDAGYPCAAVAYVQQKLDGTFTVVCKPKVRTNSFVAFSLDPDTRSVTSL